MPSGVLGTTVLQSSSGAAGAGILAGLGILLFLMFLFFAVFALVPLIGLWKVFEKAGQPGWAAFVPIYNALILARITDNPDVYVVGIIIPVVNILVSVKFMLDLAERFGKGTGYAVGLILLPFVFLPMLGFGSAQYRGGRSRGRATAEAADF